MSTKVSLLSGEGYHFYYDYKDDDIHIDYKESGGVKEFLERVAKILFECPFGDCGLHMIDLKDPSKSGKWDNGNELNCPMLERKRLELGLSSRMYLCDGCNHMVQNGKSCVVCEFEKMMSAAKEK